MNEKKICVDIIIGVLRTLKNKCEDTKHCSNCDIYNQSTDECLLKDYPEYYDLLEIEKRIIKIIENELKDGETK